MIFLQVRAKLQKMGALSPMNIFLRQEIDRMQRVITAVRNTLTDLKLAIDGTIIMSEVSRENLFKIRPNDRAHGIEFILLKREISCVFALTLFWKK